MCESDQRRAWLTGFTGSAGTAIVTHADAFVWTDARYFIQAITLTHSSFFSLSPPKSFDAFHPLHAWLTLFPPLFQAAAQLGPEWTLMKSYEPGVLEPQDWLGAQFTEGGRIGVDPAIFDNAKARGAANNLLFPFFFSSTPCHLLL